MEHFGDLLTERKEKIIQTIEVETEERIEQSIEQVKEAIKENILNINFNNY